MIINITETESKQGGFLCTKEVQEAIDKCFLPQNRFLQNVYKRKMRKSKISSFSHLGRSNIVKFFKFSQKVRKGVVTAVIANIRNR